jgi:hypothetical protein
MTYRRQNSRKSNFSTEPQQLIKEFGTSKAAIIRRLITQATPEDFPKSSQMRAAERLTQQPRH